MSDSGTDSDTPSGGSFHQAWPWLWGLVPLILYAVYMAVTSLEPRLSMPPGLIWKKFRMHALIALMVAFTCFSGATYATLSAPRVVTVTTATPREDGEGGVWYSGNLTRADGAVIAYDVQTNLSYAWSPTPKAFVEGQTMQLRVGRRLDNLDKIVDVRELYASEFRGSAMVWSVFAGGAIMMFLWLVYLGFSTSKMTPERLAKYLTGGQEWGSAKISLSIPYPVDKKTSNPGAGMVSGTSGPLSSGGSRRRTRKGNAQKSIATVANPPKAQSQGWSNWLFNLVPWVSG